MQPAQGSMIDPLIFFFKNFCTPYCTTACKILTDSFILVSLDNKEENCILPSLPEAVGLTATSSYMDSIGAVVVCGLLCYAFNGTSWILLEYFTQEHCWLGSFSVVVEQGLWVMGPLASDGLGCSETGWASEVYAGGEGWIQGPQHPNDFSLFSCLVNVNSTHTLYTGGNPTFTESWLYDWTAGEWSPTGNLNQGRNVHGCAVLEGQGVLVAGGQDINTNNLNSAELWNPETGIWTLQPSFPQDIIVGLLLSTGDESLLALAYETDKIYQRAKDGTWSALNGVFLPGAFEFGITGASLVADDFAAGCV